MNVGLVPVGLHPVGLGLTQPPAPLSSLLQKSLVYLVEVTVQSDSSDGDSTPGVGGDSVGLHAVGMNTGDAGDTGSNVLRFSDRGYITNPNDDPPNALYDGRAKVPLSLRRQLSLSPESLNNGGANGEIVLVNSDAGLSTELATNAIDGHDVWVRVVEEGKPYSESALIWHGVGKSWRDSGNGDVRIRVQDASYRMGRPVQPNIYGGAGGLDGTSDLEGTPKPLAMGLVRNASPILIDPANLIYQIHDGSVQSIDAVYDRAASLTDEGDTTDLYSGSTSAGAYRTDKADGLIQLGESPSGQVTADVHGDDAGGYIDTVPEIALRLAKFGGLPDADVDGSSFTNLVGHVPGTAGYYVPAEGARPTVSNVVTELLQGIGGYWYGGRDGRIRVDRLNEPDPLGTILTLDETNILNLEQMRPPDAMHPPSWRRTVAYRKNWTLQDTDLDASVTDTKRQFLAREWRTAEAQNTSIRTKYPEAKDPPPVPSHLDEQADAEALAQDLIDIWGADRRLLRVEVDSIGSRIGIGESVIVKWPTLGLETGVPMVAFPIREDLGQANVKLMLWG